MTLPRPTSHADLLPGVSQLVDELDRSRLVPNAHGLVTVTWPGASAISNLISVAHGLGVIPACVLATLNDQAGSGFCWVVAFRDATNISLQLQTGGFLPANTVTNPVSWLAFTA